MSSLASRLFEETILRPLLAVVFYLLLTPMAVLARALGARPLDLSWRNGRSSYRVKKSRQVNDPGRGSV